MRRLISPANDGGLPYVNSDFNDILQKEHLLAYAGHLNSINDIGFVNGGNFDRGIVLQGCLATNPSALVTQFDFTSGLVYIPGATGTGDFYEPHPTIAISNYTVNTNLCYIIPDPNPTNENRLFRSGASLGVIEKKYFTVVTSVGATTPHIQFLNAKTRRRYKRVLKYALANVGDIFTTGNLTDFNSITGVGEGDMYGFQLCNGLNSSYDLRGRFAMGFDPTTLSNPVDATTVWNTTTSTQTYNGTDIKNYATIGNIGGGRLTDGIVYPSKVLIIPELPAHDHGSQTGGVIGDMNHTHEIVSGDNYNGSSANSRTGRGFNNPTTMSSGNVNGGTLAHIHSIPAQGSFNGHEIRSPYIVMAYYQKIAI
jgi:hypothetical protein